MLRPLAVLALAALPVATAAQTPPPASLAPAPAPAPPAMAQPINIVPATVRYAQCLATQRPTQADAYLVTVPGSPQELSAFDALVPVGDTVCAGMAPAAAGGAAAIPVMFLRGALAEARYLARHGGGAPATIADAAPFATDDAASRARLAAAADPAFELTRMFGDCVVDAYPMYVDRFIRAEAGSATEREAISSIQPALGSCLYANQTVQFTRETLRAPLADALYRKAEGVVTDAPTFAPPPSPEADEGR